MVAPLQICKTGRKQDSKTPEKHAFSKLSQLKRNDVNKNNELCLLRSMLMVPPTVKSDHHPTMEASLPTATLTSTSIMPMLNSPLSHGLPNSTSNMVS